MTTGNLSIKVVINATILVAFAAHPSAGAGDKFLPAPVRDSQHQFQRYVCSWQQLKRQNVVMQRRDYSCGAAALATLIRYYWGDPVNEETFLKELDKLLTPEEVADRVKNGLTITDLRRAAVSKGYLATLGKLPFNKLVESKVPVLLGVTIEGFDHFVVYRGWDGQYVYLADPIQGNIRVHTCDFGKQWQKNAILAVAKKGEKVREVSRLSVRGDEMALGSVNWQYVRSRAIKLPPSRVPIPPIR
jgi:predicted double-glycine peptidase